MLQSWLQGLPDDYAVKDLINEMKDWIEDEYVKETIWKRLQNCVAPGLLPTFSERRSARKHSGSSSPGHSPVTEDRDPFASITPDVPNSEKKSSVEKNTASPGALTRK